MWRFAGAEDQVYRNGTSFGTSFDGVGDISMGDDAYQAFFARGNVKRKFDGANWNNWANWKMSKSAAFDCWN